MQLVVNRNIHRSSGTSKNGFLEKLFNVKAIRVNRDVWTINLYSALTMKQTCPTKALFQMVKNGDFALYSGQSSEYIFGVRITKALFEFINSTSYASFLKQYLAWISTQVIDDPRTTGFFLEKLGKSHTREIERIVENHSPPLGQDLDDIAYSQIFLKESGEPPYEFFCRGAQHDDAIKQKFNMLESGTHYCFGIDEVYFTSIDWRNILERGEADPLSRCESDFEVWEEWKEHFSSPKSKQVSIQKTPFEINESGYVYLIHQKDTDLYKIGWSKTPNGTGQRLRQLQVGNPDELYVHASFPVSNEMIERKLQRLFEHKKERGEWFHLNEVELTNILNPSWRTSNGIT